MLIAVGVGNGRVLDANAGIAALLSPARPASGTRAEVLRKMKMKHVSLHMCVLLSASHDRTHTSSPL